MKRIVDRPTNEIRPDEADDRRILAGWVRGCETVVIAQPTGEFDATGYMYAQIIAGPDLAELNGYGPYQNSSGKFPELWKDTKSIIDWYQFDTSKEFFAWAAKMTKDK